MTTETVPRENKMVVQQDILLTSVLEITSIGCLKDYLKETLDLGRDDFKVDVKEGFSLTQILSTDKVWKY
jgi:hypothetical protein